MKLPINREEKTMSKYILSAFADEAGESLEEQIAALKRNGIRYMEVRAVNGVNICKTPLATVAEYKKQLDEAGIQVVTIGSGVGKVAMDDNWDAHLAFFLHTLGVAKILGATRIRMFSIFMPEGQDPAQYRSLVMERMQQLLEIAKAVGVTLYHENEKDIYGDVDSRVVDLMDTFEGKMQFIFDPANYVQCGCKPLEIYPALRDRTAYFHIKDALSSDNSVVPAGEGDGDVRTLLVDFAKDHEDTMLTIEPHLKVFPGLTDTVSMRSDKDYIYESNEEAFDVAVNALKKILEQEGLSYA